MITKQFKKKKILKRIRHSFSNQKNFIRRSYFLFSYKKRTFFKKQLCIRLTQNNIFCTLSSTKKKIITNLSSGKIKLQTTKKLLKYNTKIMLNFFLKKVLKTLDKSLIIKITGPIHLRKFILKNIRKYLKSKKQKIMYNIQSKKCFNGCRPPKKKRKKRKILQYFK